ncbi:hypothetical protein SAMN02745248_01694 [Hathewaya proteolytica DSM 3090]|uniref:Uncharacterized protein n=1 Tax=Hathewaya proteolytica DSM 3090 TaxID=1121331 RepID=A0A1M6PGT8_9CLOT|nr:hypothetical protein [Hathewaya proteolytica]SHK07122.1 hypothetical protein SAMN02745248_01694 [Hathewaya proteolytica DSM 3090]
MIFARRKKLIMPLIIIGAVCVGVLSFISLKQTVKDNMLYKKVFYAVKKASEDKTQESVISARRVSKELLDNPRLAYAEQYFSTSIDTIQQELFDNIEIALTVDEESPKQYVTQQQINEARALADGFLKYEENEKYRALWSGRIDSFQQEVIRRVKQAVDVAQGAGTDESIKLAKEFVEELFTSTNEDTRKEAERLNQILNSIQK